MPEKIIRVLLIDDDDVFGTHVTRMLKKISNIYHVEWIGDSELGYEAVLREEYDICLLDFNIDNIDGLDILERSSHAGRQKPIVFLTGDERKEIDTRALLLGASDFLVKYTLTGVALARTISYVIHNTSLMNQLQTANDRYQEDLKAAAEVQYALLPKTEKTATTIPDYTFALAYKPSSVVSGDQVNYFEIDEHRLGMYCVDVSGHGVPAAMLAVQLHRIISPGTTYISEEGFSLVPEDFLEPAQLLHKLNDMFLMKKNNFKYFTLLYAVIERRTGHVSFATAGHPPPIIMRGDGEIVETASTGVPIGMMPNITYDAYDHILDEGDTFLMYSDGVNEATNSQQEMYGYERLVTCMQQHVQQPLDICAQVEQEISAWQCAQLEADDCTLLSVLRCVL